MRLYSIGQVSKRSGLSVQTIRHYSDMGLLPPSHIAPSGYRFYSEADQVRLELIRALRSLDFDLATIGRLLSQELSAQEAVALQLAALEAQMQNLKLQQTVLKAVVASGEVSLGLLERLQGLARLSKQQREAFLAQHLQKGLEGLPTNPEIWQAAVLDLPEEIDQSQLEAWLELSDLVSDPAFAEVLQHQAQPFRGRLANDALLQSYQEASQTVMARGLSLMQQGCAPQDPAAQALVEEWLQGLAPLFGDQQGLRSRVLNYFAKAYDLRMERYWQLIAQIKSLPQSNPYAGVMDWLLMALRT